MSLIENDNPRVKRPKKIKLSPRGRIAALDNGKHPGGRDRLYDPAMCDRAIALGEEGASIAQIAADLRISKDTIRSWINDFEEFGEAMSQARTASQAWWEAKGQANLNAKVFQGNVWQFSMSRRFRDDYGGREDAPAAPNVTINMYGVEMLEQLIDRRSVIDATHTPNTIKHSSDPANTSIKR